MIKAWEQTRGTVGPNPDGQLGQIVEVMLGTSARIGEVLAIRRCDLDVTTRADDAADLRDDRVQQGGLAPTGSRTRRPTVEHCIRHNEHVNPLTAELLDAAFASEEPDNPGALGEAS